MFLCKHSERFGNGAYKCLYCIVFYHLVYMNTSILLVESQVILNRITGFKSKISSSAHSRQKRAGRSAHDAFGVRVYQRCSHITCLITVIRKISI